LEIYDKKIWKLNHQTKESIDDERSGQCFHFCGKLSF